MRCARRRTPSVCHGLRMFWRRDFQRYIGQLIASKVRSCCRVAFYGSRGSRGSRGSCGSRGSILAKRLKSGIWDLGFGIRIPMQSANLHRGRVDVADYDGGFAGFPPNRRDRGGIIFGTPCLWLPHPIMHANSWGCKF
eukprot:scaffold7339_cov249-Pinguiococcus_pyrenoidosus.AAC.7